ncbi:hypothetical protein ABPG75_004230 [Micractinium tetrahymenae]
MKAAASKKTAPPPAPAARQVRAVVVCRPPIAHDARRLGGEAAASAAEALAELDILAPDDLTPDDLASDSPDADLERYIAVGKDRDHAVRLPLYGYRGGAGAAALCEREVAPLLARLLAGESSAIIAYGQTGSGKSYTMGTEQYSKGTAPAPHSVGAFCARRVFELARERGVRDLEVSVSVVEIYREGRDKERLFDLQTPERRRIESFESQVSWLRAASPEELQRKLLEAAIVRQTDRTDGNARSSRSHAIFVTQVQFKRQQEGGGGVQRIKARLMLVDLAGSERAALAAANSTSQKQGSGINVGLLYLGMILKELSERGATLNYRLSVLTEILKPALGGGANELTSACNTLVVGCISPLAVHAANTRSTLEFLQQAGKVTNLVRPDVQMLRQQELEAQVEYLQKKVQQLELEKRQRGTRGVADWKADAAAAEESTPAGQRLPLLRLLPGAEEIVCERESHMSPDELAALKGKVERTLDAVQDGDGRAQACAFAEACLYALGAYNKCLGDAITRAEDVEEDAAAERRQAQAEFRQVYEEKSGYMRRASAAEVGLSQYEQQVEDLQRQLAAAQEALRQAQQQQSTPNRWGTIRQLITGSGGGGGGGASPAPARSAGTTDSRRTSHSGSPAASPRALLSGAAPGVAQQLGAFTEPESGEPADPLESLALPAGEPWQCRVLLKGSAVTLEQWEARRMLRPGRCHFCCKEAPDADCRHPEEAFGEVQLCGSCCTALEPDTWRTGETWVSEDPADPGYNWCLMCGGAGVGGTDKLVMCTVCKVQGFCSGCIWRFTQDDMAVAQDGAEWECLLCRPPPKLHMAFIEQHAGGSSSSEPSPSSSSGSSGAGQQRRGGGTAAADAERAAADAAAVAAGLRRSTRQRRPVRRQQQQKDAAGSDSESSIVVLLTDSEAEEEEAATAPEEEVQPARARSRACSQRPASARRRAASGAARQAAGTASRRARPATAAGAAPAAEPAGPGDDPEHPTAVQQPAAQQQGAAQQAGQAQQAAAGRKRHRRLLPQGDIPSPTVDEEAQHMRRMQQQQQQRWQQLGAGRSQLQALQQSQRQSQEDRLRKMLL